MYPTLPMRWCVLVRLNSKGDLSQGQDFRTYSQVIDSFRDIKFFCERAGIPVEHDAPALMVINHNPFNPAQALVDNEFVFKEALEEVDALEADFVKAQQALTGGHAHPHL
jgi:hypothetical protein